jgi:hypothetical protein
MARAAWSLSRDVFFGFGEAAIVSHEREKRIRVQCSGPVKSESIATPAVSPRNLATLVALRDVSNTGWTKAGAR